MLVDTTPAGLHRYLDLLYPGAPDDAWVVVSWFTPGSDVWASAWYHAADREGLIACIATHAATAHVYLGLGLRHPRCMPSATTRGTSADVLAIGALWIEFDHREGSHAAANLPTVPELRRFIDELPFSFSLLVDSGGGFHGYCHFKELWILDNEQERAKAALLLQRFQRTLQLRMAEHGWHVDSTADLARVLRPPETWNHKTSPTLPVTILEETPIAYNPSDLDDAPWMATIDDMYIPPPAQHNGAFPPTALAPIVAGCAWLQHCQTDAARLPEPEWYAMLGIVGRCIDGEAQAHVWSAPYPGYDARKTAHKLKHALEDAGPRKCHGIRYSCNADAYCANCSHWGRVVSPIVLGMPRTAPTDDPLGSTLPAPAPVGWGRNGVAAASPQDTPNPLTGMRDPEQASAWFQEQVKLYENKKGIIAANNTTIMAFLQNHSYWQGKLWWDDLANKAMVGEQPLTDALVTQIGALFGKKHALPIQNDRHLARCIEASCIEHRRDPLQDWLMALPGWDGVPRLHNWLIDCAGVIATAYHQYVSAILPISMIARAFDPGCLYRNVIILEGPEEYRKSTFVAALVPFKSWRLSLVSSFESKDVPMLIQGIWIAELTELDSLSRTAETRLKSFISDTEDAYVPKWQIFRTAPKRRTIFVGTTNEHTYFRGTGNTRFLPVRIEHPIDVEGFLEQRDQLFAEAMLWYGDHRETWWSMPEEVRLEANLAREERREVSIYEGDLGIWLATERFKTARELGATSIPIEHETTWAEIATGFLRLDTPEKWKDMNLQRQVGSALKALGWSQKVGKREGKSVRVWRYEPPVPF